jgi:hypothetical protein
MSNPESIIQNAIRIAASTAGARVFRNQVGSYRLADGRWITSGLCVGSSDLIGWTVVNGVAVFTAIEVKTVNGRTSKEQDAFIAAVERDGGLAAVVRSPQEVLFAIETFRKKHEE